MAQRPDGIERMDLSSEDLVADRVDMLKQLFPEVVVEAKSSNHNLTHTHTSLTSEAIDFDKLRLILGDEVDEGQERYAFTWPGKADAIRQSQTPSTATLRPDPEASVNWDETENLYIEGDNLEVLKLLQRGYHGRVKMIYIDPPYNTNHDFVYLDTFADSVENYKEQAGLTGQSNPETSGRFHSDWLSMMYPRLRLARELLTEDGAIFLSIDENEVDNLRKLCDEVFGAPNFVAQVVWSGGRKNDSKYISVSHEYVLIYAKSTQYLKDQKIIWRKRKEGLDEIYAEVDHLRQRHGDDYEAMSRDLKAWYKALPEGHPSKAHKHYSSFDKNGLFFGDNISWPGGGGPRYEVLHPVTGKPVAVPSRGWLFGTPERMQEMIAEGRVQFGPDETKVPTLKRYLKETEYEAPYSVIYKDGRAATKRLTALMGEKVFDNPKDVDVIKEFISYLGDEDCIVMDFFSGSGTTAEAVMELDGLDGEHLQFILVQLPEDLDEKLAKTTKTSAKKVLRSAIALCNELDGPHELTTIAEERIRRAGARVVSQVEEENRQLKIGEEPKAVPDVGFRVLKLDSSNIERFTLGDLMDDQVKPGRTKLDVIFEMMLKWGLELSLPMERASAAGYPVTVVAGGELVCCMDEGLTNEAVLAIMDEFDPRRVLFLDSVLTDSIKLNALETFRRAEERLGHPIDLRTV